MTNPLKGEVQVNLGTEVYNCRLTIDAIIKIETQLDKGILHVTQRLAEADIRVSELSVILLHALRGGGNDIDEKEVKRLIQEHGIVVCCQAVAELLTSVLMKDVNDDLEESSSSKKEEAAAQKIQIGADITKFALA